MSDLLIIFTLVTFLFVLFVIVQGLTNWRFCAICSAVSATWLVFLLLYWLGKFQNPLLIAPLLGASAVGIYYLVEKKTKESWHLFRLPFLLTLFLAVYLLLFLPIDYFELLLFLVILWLVVGIIFLSRENPRFKFLAKRIIDCCKNW